MDEAGGRLMGAHGYCTQEMVNLLLGGRAASNVFNDSVTLDGAPGEKGTVLRGVQKRSDVGLLSLFEHYKSCQVGGVGGSRVAKVRGQQTHTEREGDGSMQGCRDSTGYRLFVSKLFWLHRVECGCALCRCTPC